MSKILHIYLYFFRILLFTFRIFIKHKYLTILLPAGLFLTKQHEKEAYPLRQASKTQPSMYVHLGRKKLLRIKLLLSL